MIIIIMLLLEIAAVLGNGIIAPFSGGKHNLMEFKIIIT